MRKVLTGIALLLLIAAAVLALRDHAEQAGALWASINPNSLVGLQSLIENKIDPDLWVDVVLPMLTRPAWVIPGGLGLILVFLARPWLLGRRRPGDIDA